MLTETAGKTPELILIATGSELQLAVGAKAELEKRGHAIRVVSMPSFELFERQDGGYRDSVLPRAINRRLAIEAGVSFSWYRWVGPEGAIIGLKTFAPSPPSPDCLQHFALTLEIVAL